MKIQDIKPGEIFEIVDPASTEHLRQQLWMRINNTHKNAVNLTSGALESFEIFEMRIVKGYFTREA